MNWLQAQNTLSRHEFGLKSNAFRPDFVSRLNEVFSESMQNRGRFKPRLLGTVAQAFTDGWLQSMSRLVKPEMVVALLDTEIWATAVAGGVGFATGTYEGRRIIALHPEQAEVDYVPGLLHEIKHVADILNGKEVSLTNSPDGYRLPSERRARDFEKKFIDRMYRDYMKGDAKPMALPFAGTIP
jgi:hypothetical protein